MGSPDSKHGRHHHHHHNSALEAVKPATPNRAGSLLTGFGGLVRRHLKHTRTKILFVPVPSINITAI